MKADLYPPRQYLQHRVLQETSNSGSGVSPQADPDMQSERESYPRREMQVDSKTEVGPIGAMVGRRPLQDQFQPTILLTYRTGSTDPCKIQMCKTRFGSRPDGWTRRPSCRRAGGDKVRVEEGPGVKITTTSAFIYCMC